MGNPDEILLDDDEDDELVGEGVVSEEKGCKDGCEHGEVKATNPDEIDVEMDDEEEEEVSALLVEQKADKGKGKAVEMEVEVEKPQEKSTRFLALSKPGYNKDFLQVRLSSLATRVAPLTLSDRLSRFPRPLASNNLPLTPPPNHPHRPSRTTRMPLPRPLQLRQLARLPLSLSTLTG